jgi:hypothetical protein
MIIPACEEEGLIADALPKMLPECRSCLDLEQESRVYLINVRYTAAVPPRPLVRSYACSKKHEWDEAA